MPVQTNQQFPPYEYREYPKWLHREGQASVVVNDGEAEAAQLAAWDDVDPFTGEATISKSMPWFSLKKYVKEQTGQDPKSKGEALALLSEAGISIAD